MNPFLELIEKAKMAILSSEFLEKNAEEQFKKMDELDSEPWTLELETEKKITLNKIKNIIGKSEIEYKNLVELEAEVNKHIKKKSRKD
jgi:hypothetical protein